MNAQAHDALCFWCDAYRAGYRITRNKTQFIYHSIDYLRIQRTKCFGLLDTALCTPPPDIASEAEARQVALLPLLTQPVPKELAYWWYHILSLDMEGKPVLRMAARRGVAVWLLPCRGGVWPLIVDGPPGEAMGGMPALSPILVNNGYNFRHESYSILGESHVKTRENGNNRMVDNVGSKVREASAREPGRGGSRTHTGIAGRENRDGQN